MKWQNIKLSNSQLNKLKSGTKNDNKLTSKLLQIVAGDSNDENNFPHKLLLIIILAWKLGKAFANNSSANIKLSRNSNA